MKTIVAICIAVLIVTLFISFATIDIILTKWKDGDLCGICPYKDEQEKEVQDEAEGY